MSLHLCLLGDASHVHTRRWAAEMLARGWRVSIVTALPMAQDGVEQIVLPPVRRSLDWLWRVSAARRAVDALQPDILHAHYITSYGYLAARCGARPLVLTAWGSDLLVTPFESRLKKALTGWTLRQAQAITGDSADLVGAARAYGPAAELLELHWGVDLKRFVPTPWERRSGFEIVSLRSWSANYRIDLILRAVARLRGRVPGLFLHLLGGGPDERALLALTNELDLQGIVRFHGRLDDAGMSAVMARCRVAVTVPASDATSVSLLESMACGLAVVASDLPANRQWLAADNLVPVDDDAALADRLFALAYDDAACRAQAEANALRMQREGSRAAQMDRADALYRRLLQPRILSAA